MGTTWWGGKCEKLKDMIIFETGWQCQTECENVRQSLWTVYCQTAACPLGMPSCIPIGYTVTQVVASPNGHANRIVLYSKPPCFGDFSLKSQTQSGFLYSFDAVTLLQKPVLRQVPQRADGGFGDGDSELLWARQRQSGGFLPQGGSPRILQVPPVWLMGFRQKLAEQYIFSDWQFQYVHCGILGSLVLGGSLVLVSSGPSAGSKGEERSATIGSGIWWANIFLQNYQLVVSTL